jgi:hypothetical protein
MKKYVLALSLFISALAIAQPPADKPEDKPKDKSVSNEHKKKKPEEKKDKKPRTFRLIGVEASRGHINYNSSKEWSVPSTKSDMYRGLIDDGSVFFSNFGDNTPTQYNSNYSPLIDYSTRGNWENLSGQTDISTTWGFGKRGNVNQKHVIKIGAGWGYRNFNITGYNKTVFEQRDTLGYYYVGGDTIAQIKDTTVFISTSLENTVNWGHIALSYNYRIHPEEKLSLSIGGGFDALFGTFSTLGTISQYNRSSVYGRSVSSGTEWSYYDNQNSIYKATSLGVVDEKRFKAFGFRPWVSVRIDYRLSKKFPILKNINVFADGRYGIEYSNIGKKMHSKGPNYLGLRFGIAYNLFKGL